MNFQSANYRFVRRKMWYRKLIWVRRERWKRQEGLGRKILIKSHMRETKTRVFAIVALYSSIHIKFVDMSMTHCHYQDMLAV